MVNSHGLDEVAPVNSLLAHLVERGHLPHGCCLFREVPGDLSPSQVERPIL